MNESWQSIARRLFDLVEKYIVAYRKAGHSANEFVWIRDNDTGEIIIFAKSIETVKRHIPFMKQKEDGE